MIKVIMTTTPCTRLTIAKTALVYLNPIFANLCSSLGVGDALLTVRGLTVP